MGLSFQMKTATAPGISHGSIIHCQDWRRLLCQSNVADPHHEHPPAYTASFLPAQCVCEQVCGFLNSIPQQPVLYGITLDFLIQYCFSLLWMNCLPTHCPTWSTPHPPQVLYPLLPRPNTQSQVTLSSYYLRSFFFYISSSVQMPPPHLCCHFMCFWKGKLCGMFCLCWFPSCTYSSIYENYYKQTLKCVIIPLCIFRLFAALDKSPLMSLVNER